jgi:hypothetical protein
VAGFNGIGTGMGNLWQLSDARSRSISAENFSGEKGRGGMSTDGASALRARDLGIGWKVSPFVFIEPGETFTIADIRDAGAIQQIWMVPDGRWRFIILRFYWDDQEIPSVECPLGDFFANGWGKFAQVSSLAVCVNPLGGFNCYWQMPFRKRCRITVTNIDDRRIRLFYQINYTLTEVPERVGYFHAQFRRVNPLPYKDVYTIIDGIRGNGHFVGTSMAWGSNNAGWWGEGEIKFYIDGDREFPTICGTGTEDYFCGAYGFVNETKTDYVEYTTPYAGMPQVIRGNGFFGSQQRFALYRWHVTDPVRFQQDLRVTIQALGWRTDTENRRYLPLQDDIASVAYWYQSLPTAPFPRLPEKDHLEII